MTRPSSRSGGYLPVETRMSPSGRAGRKEFERSAPEKREWEGRTIHPVGPFAKRPWAALGAQLAARQPLIKVLGGRCRPYLRCRLIPKRTRGHNSTARTAETIGFTALRCSK